MVTYNDNGNVRKIVIYKKSLLQIKCGKPTPSGVGC